MVRFGRIVQLIRYVPQMIFQLTEFFKDRSCDFTIQVNLFSFVVFIKKINKKEVVVDGLN